MTLNPAEDLYRHLDSAPEAWTRTRLRFVCRTSPSKSEVNVWSPETDVTFLGMSQVGQDGELDTSDSRVLEDVQSGYTYFRNGDVLVAKITPCFENGKGAVADDLTPGFGFGSTEFHVLRPLGDTNSQFLYYLTRSSPFRRLGEAMMQGSAGQQRVTNSFVIDFHAAIPPPAEQNAIAAFLDRRTAALDEVVALKERLLGRLAARRRAVIQHAVTRGLDAGAAMRDSGVPWIGDVPTAWRVVPLQHLTQQKRQIMYGIVLPGPHFEGGVPIVKAGNVTQSRLRLDQLRRTDPAIEQKYKRSRLKPGDLLYAIRGSIGAVEEVPDTWGNANVTQDVARVAPADGVHRRWLLHALRSNTVYAQAESGTLGATVKGVNIFDLKRFLVPTPPLPEQREIAAHLDAATASLDAASDAVTEQLARLRTYRQALIAAAVTGRVRVG